MMTRFGLRKSHALMALALGAALAGFSGCVSMDEYNKVDAALHQARAQLAEAENDLARLRQQIDALNAQLATREGLMAGYDALKAENALLKQKIADLQKKYDELVSVAGNMRLPEQVNNALEQLAEEYPDLLEWDPTLGRLRFKSDFTFELGSTEIKPEARAALQTLAGILNRSEIADNQIRIVGHTDDVPIRQSGTMSMNPNNWFLSTNRAHAVREVLQGNGVADTRLQAAGDGPTQPVAPNAPGHRGNEKNRRVEIFILPTKIDANAVAAPESDRRAIVSGARPAATPRRAPATPSRTPARTPSRTAPAAAPTTAPAAPSVPLPAPLNGAAG